MHQHFCVRMHEPELVADGSGAALRFMRSSSRRRSRLDADTDELIPPMSPIPMLLDSVAASRGAE